MNLYAESSAVLAWLLGEQQGDGVRGALAEAEIVVASDLTLVECSRVLVRATATGEAHEAAAADCRARLGAASAYWYLLRLDQGILDRAMNPFPEEPIRTLDALHLASALAARESVPGLAVLSLDQRIRNSACQLGFSVFPAIE